MPIAKKKDLSSACVSEVSKFKSMYKMGTEELHRAFCLRLSRINRDSCKILKVRTLIYYGFRRVS